MTNLLWETVTLYQPSNEKHGDVSSKTFWQLLQQLYNVKLIICKTNYQTQPHAYTL